MKQCKNHWSASYWGDAYSGSPWVCRKALTYRAMYSRLQLRKVSFKKLDLKFWLVFLHLIHHSKLVDSQKIPAVCKWQDYWKQWQDRCGEGE